MPSDIITEKLLRDGSLKVTEVEVEDALESMLTYTKKQHAELHLIYTQTCRCCLFAMFIIIVSKEQKMFLSLCNSFLKSVETI